MRRARPQPSQPEMRSAQSRLAFWLTAAAVVCVVLQVLTGVVQLAFWLTPPFVILATLLAGRYFGESKLIAAVARARTVTVKRIATRWPRRAHVALVTLFERARVQLRGPPVRRVPCA